MKKIVLLLILLFLFCINGYAMDSVNENSAAVITLTFKDTDGVLATPTTLKYRVDDLSSGTTTIAITTVAPSASSYDIAISSNENRIISVARPYEQRRLSVQWYSGTTLVGTDDYVYKVVNLNKIPFP